MPHCQYLFTSLIFFTKTLIKSKSALFQLLSRPDFIYLYYFIHFSWNNTKLSRFLHFAYINSDYVFILFPFYCKGQNNNIYFLDVMVNMWTLSHCYHHFTFMHKHNIVKLRLDFTFKCGFSLTLSMQAFCKLHNVNLQSIFYVDLKVADVISC